MKTLILNDEVEFDLSEQHGLVVRLRSRQYFDSKGGVIGRRDRAPRNEQIAPGACESVASLTAVEVAKLREFLNDPSIHRSWW